MTGVEIAIGFFDGLHIGHRKIFDAMLSRAAQMSARTLVMTFVNHPREIFAPDKAPKFLMSPKARIDGISGLGADEVIAEIFTPEVAETTAESFAERLKTDFPSLDTVFCGPNWTFGKGGEGNADFLRNRGVNVCEVPFAVLNGETVSSTRIRAALEEGDLDLAGAMLGRKYSAEGDVAKGKGLGRSIGFPTLNVTFGFLPPLRFGVYALSTPLGKAVANWGFAPTMRERAWETPVLEIHLLEKSGEEFEVPEKFEAVFEKFIRPEMRFDSIDSLKAQISRDTQFAMSLS